MPLDVLVLARKALVACAHLALRLLLSLGLVLAAHVAGEVAARQQVCTVRLVIVGRPPRKLLGHPLRRALVRHRGGGG